MKNKPESYIESRVCTYAKSKGMLVYKFSSHANRGVPDRLFVADNVVFFIEFKSSVGVLSKIQEYHIRLFREKRAAVYVVNNVEDGRRIIDSYA